MKIDHRVDHKTTIAFNGMNNIQDPAHLEKDQCVDIVNMFCTVDKTLMQRNGYAATLLTSVTSGWSDSNNSYCVYGGNICSFNGTVLTLVPGASNIRLGAEFIRCNDVVVYSDGTSAGIISGNTAYPFAAAVNMITDQNIVDRAKNNSPADFSQDASNFDVDAFKIPTLAGNCLEFFNGALYFAVNNYIYCTKTFDIENMDIRFNVVAGFPKNVTMIKRVNDGLYIGTLGRAYFLHGMGGKEGFQQKQICTSGIIKGSSVHIQAEYVGPLNAKGIAAVWTSPQGIFAGTDGGNFVNLSTNTVALPEGSAGASILYEQDGQYLYVVSYAKGTASVSKYNDLFVTYPAEESSQTWVVNLISGGHSRYTNYGFTSFFKLNNTYYGIKSGTIYSFGGELDITAKITASATSAVIDFNAQNLKTVADVYISARCDDSFYLNVFPDEIDLEQDFTCYSDSRTGLHKRRVKVPRIQGNNWQFKVWNTDSTGFVLKELGIEPSISKRTYR